MGCWCKVNAVPLGPKPGDGSGSDHQHEETAELR